MWNHVFSFDPSLPIQLAVIAMEELYVTHTLAAFEQLVTRAANYRQDHPGIPIGQIPGVEWARTIFHAIGIDPTKRRPSSEALLNRAMKDKELHAVNSLVDAGNWCSLDFLLPVCIYDSQKISGAIQVRLGRDGESYLALSEQIIHLGDRCLLADDEGPFGSPITDSKRAAVDESTTAACLILFAPVAYHPQLLQQQMDLFAARVGSACGGAVRFSALLDSSHPQI
jgi:DNA/RNA-binding domain of Phe-tRNA-synthetase-like protein